MIQQDEIALRLHEALGIQSAKKHYASPRLSEYGNLARLTQAGSGKLGDAGAGKRTAAITVITAPKKRR